MTKLSRKAQVYLEYLHLVNRINELRGNDERYRVDEEYINSEAFAYSVKYAKKVSQLEAINADCRKTIERLVAEQNRNQFYATEDGKKYKEFFETAKEDTEKELANSYRETNDKLNSFIKKLLGNEWVVRFDLSQTEIGLEDEDGRFIFGHTFTLYHYNYRKPGEKLTYANMRFDFGCGSMMSFDVFKCETRREFEIGKGKFLADTDALWAIKEIIYDGMVRCETLKEYLHHIDNLLSKPDMAYYNSLSSLAELKKRLTNE